MRAGLAGTATDDAVESQVLLSAIESKEVQLDFRKHIRISVRPSHTMDGPFLYVCDGSAFPCNLQHFGPGLFIFDIQGINILEERSVMY